MTIYQAISLAKRLMSNYTELRDWRVTTNNRKSAFGVCSYRNTQIELSKYLIPEMTDEAIKDTIIHEIAHALTKGHNHDRVWQMKCIELGGDGQRCGDHKKYKGGIKGKEEFEKKTAKYTLTCPVCGEESYRNRRPKKNSSCGLHGGRYYQVEYKLVLTQNY